MPENFLVFKRGRSPKRRASLRLADCVFFGMPRNKGATLIWLIDWYEVTIILWYMVDVLSVNCTIKYSVTLCLFCPLQLRIRDGVMPCPLCSSGLISTFYCTQNVPAFQNKAYPTQQIAESMICGDVSLSFCEDCGFVWNTTFDSSLLKYDENYRNEHGWYSPLLQYHLRTVCYILLPYLSQQSHVVEIGCGNATFLRKLGERWYTVHGYDPAYEGTDPKIVKEYYSLETVTQQSFGKADLIVLRHVLEHIADPLHFLQSIAEANDYFGFVYI